MTQESIVIKLPVPDKKLSPNSRCHWGAKSKATKWAKELAWGVAKQAMHGRTCFPWTGQVVVKCSFVYQTNANRDEDNCLASTKAYMDGIAKAGVVLNDTQFTHQPVEILPADRKSSGVTITLVKISQ